MICWFINTFYFYIFASKIKGNLQSLARLFAGQANPSEQFNTFVGIIGDAFGGFRAGKLGGKGGKKIGIKKEPKSGHLCRRKRAGGAGGCINPYFNDLENFQPVSGLRVVADSGNGPPRRVQRNPNANNRVEYVDANIQRHHLKIKSEGSFEYDHSDLIHLLSIISTILLLFPFKVKKEPEVQRMQKHERIQKIWVARSLRD